MHERLANPEGVQMPDAVTAMLSTPAYQSIEFTSDGATLRGRLYVPSGRASGVVVMAHGFLATIPMTMDKYAERFHERGLVALAFDHRGHGVSDGEPRGEINGWVQARGHIDAIDFVIASVDLGPLPIAGRSTDRGTSDRRRIPRRNTANEANCGRA